MIGTLYIARPSASADAPAPPRLFYAFAAIPFFDCIVDQVNFAFQVTVGPLSLLQVVHGALMLVFAAISLRTILNNPSKLLQVPPAAIGAYLLIGMAATKEMILTGAVSMASLAPYGQLAYWVLFWITISLVCERSEQAEILLRGLAIGAMATAFSVFLGFVLGAPNYYEEDAVISSAGWFDTAKMITGVLVTGGVVLLYLGRETKSWFYPLCACTCFAACILTYARAGSVALAAVLLWLPVWMFLFGRNGRQQWVSRFLLLILLAAALVPSVLGTDRLFARWGDVKQGDQAGSGRAAFWKIAIDSYLDASPSEQALGRGYHAMSEMLLTGYGMDIKHTHNDMLDMLTVGGIVGGVWLLLFAGTLLWRVLGCHLSSIEGGASMAILLTYLLHSQFTGQIWGTDAMSYYVLSLTCLAILAKANTVSTARAPQPEPARYEPRTATA